MATSTNPKFKQLTALQIRAVDKCLEAHCFADPQEDGRCVYEAGWDDARIAEEAIPEYPGRRAHVVGTYRIRLGYGRVISKTPKPDKATSGQKIADLEDRIIALEEQNKTLQRQIRADYQHILSRASQSEKRITDSQHRLSKVETLIHWLEQKLPV